MKLSIVIPAHNEEDRLPPVLESYASFYTQRLAEDVEILLVINGSTDDTIGIAEDIARRYPIIKVIEEPRRIGKGGAVMLGIRHANGDYVGFVDADGATDVDAFHALYTQAQGLDGAIASRWMKDSVVDLPQKMTRRIASRIFNLMTRVMFGLRFSDTQCGAKVFRGVALKKILPSLGITRWAFDVDMLYHMRRERLDVREFPTVWNDAQGSKVKIPKVAFDMTLALIRLRLIYSPFRWVVKCYDRIQKARRRTA